MRQRLTRLSTSKNLNSLRQHCCHFYRFSYRSKLSIRTTAPHLACVAGTTPLIHMRFKLSSNFGSALFTLYDSELLANQYNEAATSRVLQSMEATASRITQFSVFLFTPIEKVNINTLSPFIPYALYQAAAVQLRMWKLNKGKVYEQGVNSLRIILEHFNVRWRVAGNTMSIHYQKYLHCANSKIRDISRCISNS